MSKKMKKNAPVNTKAAQPADEDLDTEIVEESAEDAADFGEPPEDDADEDAEDADADADGGGPLGSDEDADEEEIGSDDEEEEEAPEMDDSPFSEALLSVVIAEAEQRAQAEEEAQARDEATAEENDAIDETMNLLSQVFARGVRAGVSSPALRVTLPWKVRVKGKGKTKTKTNDRSFLLVLDEDLINVTGIVGFFEGEESVRMLNVGVEADRKRMKRLAEILLTDGDASTINIDFSLSDDTIVSLTEDEATHIWTWRTLMEWASDTVARTMFPRPDNAPDEDESEGGAEDSLSLDQVRALINHVVMPAEEPSLALGQLLAFGGPLLRALSLDQVALVDSNMVRFPIHSQDGTLAGTVSVSFTDRTLATVEVVAMDNAASM